MWKWFFPFPIRHFSRPQKPAVPKRQVGTTPAYIQLGVDFAPTHSVGEMLQQIKVFFDSSES